MSETSTEAQSGSSSSAAASPARTSASPASGPVFPAVGPGSGGSTSASFALFDPDGSSWRTSQRSLLEGWTPFSGRWPRAGTMRAGTAFPLPPSAPLTAVTGSSWSRGTYPTPTVNGRDNRGGGGRRGRSTDPVRPSLWTWARTWPTPLAGHHRQRNMRGSLALRGAAETWPTATAGDAKRSGGRNDNPKIHPGTSLTDATCRPGLPPQETCTHGGPCRRRLNPRFVEWLMGFPGGWTDVA